MFFVSENEKALYICIRIQGIPDETSGEMAEWSNAAVLKTVDCNRSGGSNPSFSAMSADNQLIISLTPNITPNSIRIGCFFLIESFGVKMMCFNFSKTK